MSNMVCRYCGCSNLQQKDIEIRHVNSITMEVAFRQQVVELECVRCGWIAPSLDEVSKPMLAVAP